MRYVFILLSATLIGGLVAVTSATNATAAPVLAAAAANLAPALVVKVDYWRRYYRRHGYPPNAVVVVPAPVPDPDGPPVVEVAPILVPVRPLSCGQFRYWNGQACVDARFNNPYVGPR